MGRLQDRPNSHFNHYNILLLENDTAMTELEAHRQALANLEEDDKLSAFHWMVDWRCSGFPVREILGVECGVGWGGLVRAVVVRACGLLVPCSLSGIPSASFLCLCGVVGRYGVPCPNM